MACAAGRHQIRSLERAAAKEPELVFEGRRRRSPRRDRRLMTPGDREILRWIARHRMVTASQICERFEFGRTHVYTRMCVMKDHGAVTHDRFLYRREGVYRATPAAMRTAGLRPERYEIDIATYHREVEIVWLSLTLEREFGAEHVLTPRELRQGEHPHPLPTRDSGRRYLPDLAVGGFDDRGPLLVELVDRFQRPEGWRAPLNAYMRARYVPRVRLYAPTDAIERGLRASIDLVEAPEGWFEVRRCEYRTDPLLRTVGSQRKLPPRPKPPPMNRGAPWGRRSGGRRNLTARDELILRWVARQRLATANQVSRRFELSISTVYVRLGILAEHGLVEHRSLFHKQPGIFTATLDGIGLAGLPLRPWRVQLSSYHHDLALADICIELEHEFGADRVVTERELRADRERLAVQFGEFRGRPRYHYPDLVVEGCRDGRILSIELERSARPRRTLLSLLDAYLAARHVAGVRFYACTTLIERRLLAAAGGYRSFEVRPWS